MKEQPPVMPPMAMSAAPTKIKEKTKVAAKTLNKYMTLVNIKDEDIDANYKEIIK